MRKLIAIGLVFAALIHTGQAIAATGSATVTAKVYQPISLTVVDNGKFVFNRTSTDPAWTGNVSLDTTNTVYPKVQVSGEPSAAMTVTLSPITYLDGGGATVLSGTGILKCSTATTGSYPSSTCAALPSGGTTNVWISTQNGATTNAIAVQKNSAGKYTAALTLTVDY